MPELVLASSSPHRRELLGRLGMPFEVIAPRYEEAAAPELAPEALVSMHALGKARSVAPGRPGRIVIASDQIAVLDGRILGKPGTHERAVEQLGLLSGREHELLTALVVLDTRSGRELEHLDRTRLRVRPLTTGEIDSYVRADRPLDCAGSYRMESLGVVLFDSVRGDDPTAIVGLPLAALSRALASLGVDVLARRSGNRH